MRTTRLRQKIKKFLDDRGEANTTEILEHVNSTMRHGTTPVSYTHLTLPTILLV